MIVKLDGFPRAASFPGQREGKFVRVPRRRVEGVVVHGLGGGHEPGERFVDAYAHHAIAGARQDANGVISAGLGLAAPPHHYVIPAHPEGVDGKIAVYQLWEHEWATPSTRPIVDGRVVSVGLGGSVRCRHAPDHDPTAADPGHEQLMALRELWEHLSADLGLAPAALMPSSEIGHLGPGDVVEGWIEHVRGGEPAWLERERWSWDPAPPARRAPAPPTSSAPLYSWTERHAALRSLGFDAPDHPGLCYAGTRALRAFQLAHGLWVDGIWGPATEQRVREALGSG